MGRPSPVRIVALVAADAALLAGAFAAGFAIRFGDVPDEQLLLRNSAWPWIVGVQLVALAAVGAYRAARPSQLAIRVAFAVTSGAIGLWLVQRALDPQALAAGDSMFLQAFALPRSVALLDAVLATIALVMARHVMTAARRSASRGVPAPWADQSSG